MDFFALLMYAFAFFTIIGGPGFGGIGWPHHLALSLGLILILVKPFLIPRNWAALQGAVDGGDAEAARKKVVMSPGACPTKDGSTAAAINRPVSPILFVIPQYCGTPQKIEKMHSIPHSSRYKPLSQTGSWAPGT